MQFFNLHTHKSTNNSDVLEIINQYPWEFDATIPNYSIGIHPWYIDENRLQTDLEIIEQTIFINIPRMNSDGIIRNCSIKLPRILIYNF